jgi:hypothetical protein
MNRNHTFPRVFLQLKGPVQKWSGSNSGQNLVLCLFVCIRELPILLVEEWYDPSDQLQCYSENRAMLWCGFKYVLNMPPLQIFC